MTSTVKLLEKTPVMMHIGGVGPGCSVVDVVVQGAPVRLKEITFRNYYTASVTIKARIREIPVNGG